jgi:membrane protein DedA with SNARE-associated domain
MIPAWYLAQTGSLHIFFVILSGTLWSLVWAIVNYFVLWQLIWKTILLKYGKYFFISEKKYNKAEALFLKNDKLYTFIGRLLPVVRHLISIPAWIFKMNFFYFIFITTLWAWLWCSILTWVWYFFWKGIVELFHKYSSEANIVIALIVVIWIIYFVRKKDE